MNLGVGININRRRLFLPNELNLDFLLLEAVQLLLTSGVGAVLIVDFATRDIFVKEEMHVHNEPKFATDYDELMWLAGRQKQDHDSKEIRRFFQLRREWPEMHTVASFGNISPAAGT